MYRQTNVAFVIRGDAPTVGPEPIQPAPLLLWSTNTSLKYRLQQQYCAARHHVWCSPVFEAAALSKYAIGRNQPPSSDPCTIYRNLCEAVAKNDGGDAKIINQKTVLRGLASEWLAAGTITAEQRDEIVAIVSASSFSDWRPLIFVIPYALVRARVQLVPVAKRASIEPEYIIPDLGEHEFHIIELPYRS